MSSFASQAPLVAENLRECSRLMGARFSSSKGVGDGAPIPTFVTHSRRFLEAVSEPGVAARLRAEHGASFDHLTQWIATSLVCLDSRELGVRRTTTVEQLCAILSAIGKRLGELPALNLDPAPLKLPSLRAAPTPNGPPAKMVRRRLFPAAPHGDPLPITGKVTMSNSPKGDTTIAAHVDPKIPARRCEFLLVTDFEVPVGADGSVCSLTTLARQTFGAAAFSPVDLSSPPKKRDPREFEYDWMPRGAHRQPLDVPPGHRIVSCVPRGRQGATLDSSDHLVEVCVTGTYEIEPGSANSFRVTTVPRGYIFSRQAEELIHSCQPAGDTALARETERVLKLAREIGEGDPEGAARLLAFWYKERGTGYCDHKGLAEALDKWGHATFEFIAGLNGVGNCYTLAGELSWLGRLAGLPVAIAKGPAYTSRTHTYDRNPGHASTVTQFRRYEPTSFGSTLGFTGSYLHLQSLSGATGSAFDAGYKVGDYIHRASRAISVDDQSASLSNPRISPDLNRALRRVLSPSSLVKTLAHSVEAALRGDYSPFRHLVRYDGRRIVRAFRAEREEVVEPALALLGTSLGSDDWRVRDSAFRLGALLLREPKIATPIKESLAHALRREMSKPAPSENDWLSEMRVAGMKLVAQAVAELGADRNANAVALAHLEAGFSELGAACSLEAPLSVQHAAHLLRITLGGLALDAEHKGTDPTGGKRAALEECLQLLATSMKLEPADLFLPMTSQGAILVLPGIHDFAGNSAGYIKLHGRRLHAAYGGGGEIPEPLARAMWERVIAAIDDPEIPPDTVTRALSILGDLELEMVSPDLKERAIESLIERVGDSVTIYSSQDSRPVSRWISMTGVATMDTWHAAVQNLDAFRMFSPAELDRIAAPIPEAEVVEAFDRASVSPGTTRPFLRTRSTDFITIALTGVDDIIIRKDDIALALLAAGRSRGEGAGLSTPSAIEEGIVACFGVHAREEKDFELDRMAIAAIEERHPSFSDQLRAALLQKGETMLDVSLTALQRRGYLPHYGTFAPYASELVRDWFCGFNAATKEEARALLERLGSALLRGDLDAPERRSLDNLLSSHPHEPVGLTRQMRIAYATEGLMYVAKMSDADLSALLAPIGASATVDLRPGASHRSGIGDYVRRAFFRHWEASGGTAAFRLPPAPPARDPRRTHPITAGSGDDYTVKPLLPGMRINHAATARSSGPILGNSYRAEAPSAPEIHVDLRGCLDSPEALLEMLRNRLDRSKTRLKVFTDYAHLADLEVMKSTVGMVAARLHQTAASMAANGILQRGLPHGIYPPDFFRSGESSREIVLFVAPSSAAHSLLMCPSTVTVVTSGGRG